jgi:O-antigen/teichoic acid export membrane protein
MDLNSSAKANIFSLLPASILAAAAALAGYGVWALVIQTLSLSAFKVFFCWKYGGFRPGGTFRSQVLKDLFPFGSRVMFTNLINAAFSNIYALIIGRFYNVAQLGFFSYANKFQDIPSGLISNTFRAVSVPLLSQLNEEDERLKRILGKLIRTVAFIGFPIMFGVVLIAKPLIVFLVTEKWLPSVSILQILCFSGIFTVFNAVLQESIWAKGRSKAVLYVEILKKIVLVGLIVLTLDKGVIGLSIGLVMSSFIALILSLALSGKVVGYTLWNFTKDCFPYLTLTVLLCAAAYFLTLPIESNILKMIACITLVGGLYTLVCRLLRLEEMMEVWGWVLKVLPKGIRKTER